MEELNALDPKEIDPHEQYLLNRYTESAQALQRGEMTPEQFAEEQTKIHLQLEARADHDGLIETFFE